MNTDEPDYDALLGAVTGVRQLITHMRKTKAPAELLQEVERETKALAEKLARKQSRISLRLPLF